MCTYGYKTLAAISLDTTRREVNTKSYRVTAHLTFLDPKYENHGNYRGNRGTSRVIHNQYSRKLS